MLEDNNLFRYVGHYLECMMNTTGLVYDISRE